MGSTLADKIWQSHLVRSVEDEPDLIYIDMHLLHEVNTPVAFAGIREAGRTVRRPELTLGTEDHNTPTDDVLRTITDPAAVEQLDHIRRNCSDFGIELYSLGDSARGIVHVIGPELGLSQPGMTLVCCDSHTSTHGAFGVLAFGIGTSQVEHVLATQTLPMAPMKNMRVVVDGQLPLGTGAKDLILAIIERIGTSGGQGHVIEYQGAAIRALSMEGRMTVCNMSIEAGARAGLIAPDDVTVDYLRGLPHVPVGGAFDVEAEYWRTFYSDDDAVFDKEVHIDAGSIAPRVSWGTNPAQSVSIADRVPDPAMFVDSVERAAAERASSYMGLEPGTVLREVPIDAVFIGSCTNGRIEDLREVAEVWKGRHVAPGVRVLLVPGSEAVRTQAISEGLDKIFAAAGAPLRYSGCSMCVALNDDRLQPGQRAASTNNRNFEGRQGRGVRTHLVSPGVAAATAVMGRLAAPADLEGLF
ncbi:3-isopropylmalate dehydratase large subunit [Rhodococcus sp. 06-156-3C]|uniref:3-isopropylmalate dehydratase large subunit n=1 Tax=Nocardiaceae TaxID=85025 RepID=UPI000522F702|nr:MULTISPECIES: 3-isopropylmalate dehydratase large subunit [Rhodococcus]OZD11573.1 3-isopropylmalate dehydratase large subunit [Rhodococcus sp. 06-156-3C]OZD13571.1 3-isopropylmalate dehydratase large subunit [Rhodococcus sp. 06-156-4a]OZD22226.1 3-isopropylmalate dehydratase large subunit [Rhodococcus sp. 06-156-4C]OZD30435.1 3-isopropylmalate dehydratase large subunit [Rhodococcus sp. 06-156-3]OZD37722.1 3-isopropylmalate dehydratase large subunit [Rhodococcus sp. 06-156-3b]